MEITEAQVSQIIEKIKLIEDEISKAIVGQKEIIRQIIMAIMVGGNVLLEGVPGLGKTQLVKTLSKVMDLSFSRIQFTPDLMPADVVGTNVFVEEDNMSQFRYEKGPIFANLVLADEINRATPKTQSALLEAMQEQTVTVGNTTHRLPQPFMVLATQNPIEMEGTYPLPEAQLDRFLMKLMVKFPNLEELEGIMDITIDNKKVEPMKVIDGEEILTIREIIRNVPVAKPVQQYALKLILATHPEIADSPDETKKYIQCGSSPRGAQAILSTAKVNALINGRYNVSFEDIKYVAIPALRHRVLLNYDGYTDGVNTDELIKQLYDKIPV